MTLSYRYQARVALLAFAGLAITLSSACASTAERQSRQTAEYASRDIEAHVRSRALPAPTTAQARDLWREARLAGVPRLAMSEVADRLAEYLIEALPQDAEDRGLSDYRLTLAMGDMSSVDSDPELDKAMAIVRSRLVSNRDFTRQFRVLPGSDLDNQAIMRAINGANSDVLTDPGGTGGPIVDGGSVYVLRGQSGYDFSGGEWYTLDVFGVFDVIHFRSRDLAVSETFTRRFYYHPAASYDAASDQAVPGFITEEENERRLAAERRAGGAAR